MKLTKTDIQWLRNALCNSIAWEESLVEAWTPPPWIKISKESKKIVRGIERNIVRYKRLLAKLSGPTSQEGQHENA